MRLIKPTAPPSQQSPNRVRPRQDSVRGSAPADSQRLASIALLLAAAMSAAGLTLIWLCRADVDRPVYVSELGAQGMPTAAAFATALSMVAVSGMIVATAGDHARPATRWLAPWSPGISFAVASCLFAIASQVTCSRGCPVPFADPDSTPADLAHTTSAVLGFVFSCFAMLQIASSNGRRVLARVSLGACALVGAITVSGGLMSIARQATELGGVFEFVGVTVAIAWLSFYASWLAVDRRSRHRRDHPGRSAA